ncbi:hypothetical protein SDC9_174920 [bioreactor metagenome]|uniref:Uncharacterized protein n=1 Tax=bioreactor metagenome TaxID=1076179 RepID=A0A645GMR0_9ZZZZ
MDAAGIHNNVFVIGFLRCIGKIATCKYPIAAIINFTVGDINVFKVRAVDLATAHYTQRRS